MEREAGTMSQQALEGITVLEWARFVAGPHCGRLLADMGAEVIKVEPLGGDEARRHGPFPNGVLDLEASPLFLYVNANKKSVTLEPSKHAGANLFRRLASDVDILIEDTRPGTMKSLGLDYPALQEANPGLVYASVTPFGQTGPYAGYTAHDLNIFCSGGEAYALPGSLSHLLFPGREPVRAGGYLADYDAGACAAVAVVSALLARNISGVGQHLDISRQEAAMAVTRESIQRYSGYGELLKRDRALFFGGMFRCKDGYVILFPRENRHWLALCEVMGRQDLAADSRFEDFDGRMTHKDTLNEVLGDWVRDQAMTEVYQRVSHTGCPAGHYATAAEVAASPQLAARGFFTEAEHPRAGRLRYPTAAYHMSETMPRCERAAPLLGQHNQELFGDRLGLAHDELAELRTAGVI